MTLEACNRRLFQTLLGFLSIPSVFPNQVVGIVRIPQLLKRGDCFYNKLTIVGAGKLEMTGIVRENGLLPAMIIQDGLPTVVIVNVDRVGSLVV